MHARMMDARAHMDLFWRVRMRSTIEREHRYVQPAARAANHKLQPQGRPPYYPRALTYAAWRWHRRRCTHRANARHNSGG